VPVQTKTGLQAFYLFTAYLIPAFNFSDYDKLQKWTLSKEIDYGVPQHIGYRRSSKWLQACYVIKLLGWHNMIKTDTCSIYLKHCGKSMKTLMNIAGLRAKISNWILLNMIQDSILNLVQLKEMTDQHQMPVSFNLGKLPLLVQTFNTERIITKPV